MFLTPLIQLLQRKRYQYEVTFSLYMLTPMEKFIFSASPFSSYPLPPLPFPFHLLPNIPPRKNFRLTVSPWCSTDSFLFLFLSMIVIACSLYLPQHITTIASRVWFYCTGDRSGMGSTSANMGAGVGVPTAETVKVMELYARGLDGGEDRGLGI